MSFAIFDGELTPEKMDEMKTFDLVIRLFSDYVKTPRIWGSILWAIIVRYFIVILCVITYFMMLGLKPTRMIIIALYIFFGIFWSFFPYAFKCVLIYKITTISYCINALWYALIGLICWIIALAMYNQEEYENAKAKIDSKLKK
jgi:hypothetical protein